MELNEEQRQRVADALEERLGGFDSRCPLCGNDVFIIADGVARVPLYNIHRDGKRMARSLAQAALICERCGNTFYINLLVLGLDDLVPRKRPAPEPEA